MIEKTIELINASVINNMQAHACMASDACIYGLAEPVLRYDAEDTEIPTVANPVSGLSYAFADDDYNIGLYHRLMGKSYNTATTQTYGDYPRVSAVADLRLVCWGFADKLDATANRIEEFLQAAMPAGVLVQQSNFDRVSVFGAEFKGVPFFLPDEVFLFALHYRLQYSPDPNQCANFSDLCS